MVDFWKFLLLHLAADLVFGIQNAHLPHSWLSEYNMAEVNRFVFDWGFQETSSRLRRSYCWVSGWTGPKQAQRELEVEVVRCPEELRNPEKTGRHDLREKTGR